MRTCSIEPRPRRGESSAAWPARLVPGLTKCWKNTERCPQPGAPFRRQPQTVIETTTDRTRRGLSILALGFALLLTAAGAGTGLAVASRVAHRAVRLRAADRQQTAVAAAGQEDSVVADLRARLGAAAGTVGTLADPSRLRAAALHVSPQATRAAVLDAGGQALSSWQAAPGVTLPLPASAVTGAGVSQAFAGPDGSSDVAVAGPLPAGGELVVVVPLTASAFQAPLAGARLGATGFAQLVDPAGTVVASTTGSGAGLGWALLLVVAGLLAGVGTMVATIVRGRARTATAGAEVLGAQAVPAAPDPVPNLRALASPQDLLVATGDALA